MTPYEVLGYLVVGFLVGVLILALAVLAFGPWILSERDSRRGKRGEE